MKRRAFLAGAAGALVLPRGVAAQAPVANATLDPLLWVITKGEVLRPGRVKLELPLLAENGNAVAMKVSVDSPMSERDHVKAIHLFSERNPPKWCRGCVLPAASASWRWRKCPMAVSGRAAPMSRSRCRPAAKAIDARVWTKT